MWILQLNDMRSPKFEILTPVACAPSREDLERLIEHEAVDCYQDGRFHKHFRAGGPLEWCNKPDPTDPDLHFVDLEAVVAEMLDGLHQVEP